MKNVVIAAACVAALSLSLASCTSSERTTAHTEDVATYISNFTSADLKVSEKKIEYVFKPTDSSDRNDMKILIDKAVSKALAENGNADVLVAPQYTVKSSSGSVDCIIVKGYPATYVNFHPTSLEGITTYHGQPINASQSTTTNDDAH